MPTRHSLLPTVLSLSLLTSTPALAAQVRLGGQLEGNLTGYRAEAAAEVSVQGPLTPGGLELRGTLGGGVVSGLAGGPLTPALRLDVALIKRSGSVYYGGGLGSGVAFDFRDGGSGLPNIIFTPLLLANVHALIGKDFGTYALEGQARVGTSSGIGVFISFPLN